LQEERREQNAWGSNFNQYIDTEGTIVDVIQQADHPHSGHTIGCYGKPALGGKD
jgi:hypothetical protein